MLRSYEVLKKTPSYDDMYALRKIFIYVIHHIDVMIAKKMAVNLHRLSYSGVVCSGLRNSEEDDDNPSLGSQYTKSG